MAIKESLLQIKSTIPDNVKLVVVTKTHPIEKLMEVYNNGHSIFGENKVQDVTEKHAQLPKDIEWHFIGHLQSNKVKFIAPFISLIHSIDSFKLLKEVNKQASKHNRTIDCLLQIYIAQEDTKFGLSFSEAKEFLMSEDLKTLVNINITGLMGMATNTDNEEQTTKEFQSLKDFFTEVETIKTPNVKLETLSMGMSSDYQIAIKNGSNLVRIGSSIFGKRAYTTSANT